MTRETIRFTLASWAAVAGCAALLFWALPSHAATGMGNGNGNGNVGNNNGNGNSGNSNGNGNVGNGNGNGNSGSFNGNANSGNNNGNGNLTDGNGNRNFGDDYGNGPGWSTLFYPWTDWPFRVQHFAPPGARFPNAWPHPHLKGFGLITPPGAAPAGR